MAHSRGHRPDRRDLLALGAGAFTAASLGCNPGVAASSSAREQDAQAAQDERFADLKDQRSSVPPIRPAERAERRKRAGAILSQHGLDALVVEGGPTLMYLSGISWGYSERLFALVVLADGSHFWISPAFEAEKARLKLAKDPLLGNDVVVWQEDEYAYRPLAAELERRNAKRIAIDPAARFFVAEGIADAHGRGHTRIGTDIVLALRGKKSPTEIALMRKASELTQTALAAANRHIRPGMTGGEISELVQAAEQRLGLIATWDLSLVGPAAAYPHGDASSAKLEKDQLLLVDTGGSFHGYQSDVTRTWVPQGQPHEKELAAWRAVRDAQKRAFEAVKPGVVCATVDRLARETIERAGFGAGYQHFTHRLGHGIGLEGHEAPYFDMGNQTVLASGMTLTIEPGVYVLGEFGVRIEDDVLVTDSGAEVFGAFQKDPLSPA